MRYRFFQNFAGLSVSRHSAFPFKPNIPAKAGIIAVGLNHTTAPVQVREQLSWNSEQLPGLLEDLHSCGIPGVALSTCNRSEFYFLETLDGNGYAQLGELLTRRFGASRQVLERHLYVHKDYQAILHLFRVVSGLDSMMVGEEQIIGQVRQAYNAARQAGTATGLLSRMFQQASRAGRLVRRQTGIGDSALSVSRACVELARSVVGDLSASSVLVVGAGEAGQAATEALRSAGSCNITVTNRTYARAVELAGRLSGRAVSFDRLPEALGDSDIVIGCTGSPGYVLQAGLIARAMALRPERPLFLVDIAVPRDIHPGAANVSSVSLRDIDDLEAMSQASREGRAQQIADAEALAREEASGFDQWRRGLDSLPPVIGLRQHADKVRRQELQRTLKRLDGKLTGEELASLDAMTKAIVNKLLHSPTAYLKGQPVSRGLTTAEEIFGLEIQPEADNRTAAC